MSGIINIQSIRELDKQLTKDFKDKKQDLTMTELKDQVRYRITTDIITAIRNLKSKIQYNSFDIAHDVIFNSGAFVTLEDSMYELVKNALDSGASKLVIAISSVTATAISIKILDDGCGFPKEKLGIYTTSKEDLGISSKNGDVTKKGGKNTALVHASATLKENNGSLHIQNIVSPGFSRKGSIITFSSDLQPCRYRISDHQIATTSALFAHKTSVLMPLPANRRDALKEKQASFSSGRGSSILLGTSVSSIPGSSFATPSPQQIALDVIEPSSVPAMSDSFSL